MMNTRITLTAVALFACLLLLGAGGHQHGERIFPTPADARKSPPEKLAYVVATYAGTGLKKPDYLATIDLDPASKTYAQVIHRLIDSGEFLNLERVLKQFQLPHSVLFEPKEHDPRGAVFLVRLKELRKGRLNHVENVMGEGRGPRELHLDPPHQKLLGLQRDESPTRGEPIFPGLEAGVFNILGELGQHKIAIARRRRERLPFLDGLV